ncbi:MAG: hypothetical protein V3U78_06860 [Thiotrichaceae bacterium]
MKQQNKTGASRGFVAMLLTTLTISMLSSSAFAEGSAANGKVLYDKSQCQKCHGTEVFTREDHKVKDLAGLGKQVRMCDSQLSVNWFDDEIADVVSYLNESFYKFEENDGDKKEELPKL